MNKTKMMNLEQLEEVAGGSGVGSSYVSNGRLTQGINEIIDMFAKIAKKRGDSLEGYLAATYNPLACKEYNDAVAKYTRTFWDRY